MWESYFDNLSNPKSCESFDKEHFKKVNEFVEEKSREVNIDPFMTSPFTEDEVMP